MEYDVDQCVSTGQLESIRSLRYDQSAIPQFVTLLPLNLLSELHLDTFEDVLLIIDNQLKVKLLDVNSGSILFTILGPIFGENLSQIKVFVSFLCIFSKCQFKAFQKKNA